MYARTTEDENRIVKSRMKWAGRERCRNEIREITEMICDKETRRLQKARKITAKMVERKNKITTNDSLSMWFTRRNLQSTSQNATMFVANYAYYANS